MPGLLTILTFYYTCDQAAISGALDAEQVALCNDAYNQVKTHFLTPAEADSLGILTVTDRSARLRKGYLRFKRWEAANPDVVAVLKRRAAALG